MKHDYDKPVAYDAQGQPLYAHPPKGEEAKAVQPQVVHLSRAVIPEEPHTTPEIEERHERSSRAFPWLNLSKNEYVILAVRRHPIGLIIPLAIGALIITLALSALINFSAIVEAANLTGPIADAGTVATPILLFCVLIGLGMFIVYYVYVNNRFFLTNESVIQEIQVSLFSKLEQTVSLTNIEDASFTQQNIIQQLFNYGAIRLSTEGEETTYRFTYVANPKHHVAILNNAVEAFKNGRPVDQTDD